MEKFHIKLQFYYFDCNIFCIAILRHHLQKRYIYYSKEVRISCAYFFVLSTSNYCRLCRGQEIKLQFSEDVSYMTISNFCEKQFVLKDTTLIVQKPLFHPKIQNFDNLCFINIFTTSVKNFIRVVAMLTILSCCIQQYPHQNPVHSRKL